MLVEKCNRCHKTTPYNNFRFEIKEDFNKKFSKTMDDKSYFKPKGIDN